MVSRQDSLWTKVLYTSDSFRWDKEDLVGGEHLASCHMISLRDSKEFSATVLCCLSMMKSCDLCSHVADMSCTHAPMYLCMRRAADSDFNLDMQMDVLHWWKQILAFSCGILCGLVPFVHFAAFMVTGSIIVSLAGWWPCHCLLPVDCAAAFYLGPFAMPLSK